MKRSTTRILTTHTGSLPRPKDLINLLIEEQARPGSDRTILDAAIERAVAAVVQNQADAGLDVINDGEQGRVNYTVYIKDRLTGFEGESAPPHYTDVPLKDIVDVVLNGRPAALSFPGANPCHEHEWKIWKDVKLPEGKILKFQHNHHAPPGHQEA